jgi:hypothetical protein
MYVATMIAGKHGRAAASKHLRHAGEAMALKDYGAAEGEAAYGEHRGTDAVERRLTGFLTRLACDARLGREREPENKP